MKNWLKILFIIVIIFVILFSITYIFVVFRGKAIMVKQLETLTHKKITIGYFGLTPPLHLEIKNLNIEGLAKVDSVFVSPNIISFLSGKIVLNSIRFIKPQLTYKKVPPQLSESDISTGFALPATVKPDKNRPLPVVFKRLKVKEGRLDFTDHTISPEGLNITIKDISCSLSNVYFYPRSAITNFELRGKIPWKEGAEEGKIELEGWLNLFKKDIQATLKIEDIDGLYLYPYYSKWVDLEKARIQKAKLNFTSDIQGLNNNVTANCHLELADIVFKPRASEEEQEKAEKIASAVLDIFKALNQGKIVLDFTIRTKMDRPEFGFGNIKMAFEDKLSQAKKSEGFNPQDVLILPVKLIEGTVKAATDLSKAVINGTFAVGNEIKKSVEGTFKKEKKE